MKKRKYTIPSRNFSSPGKKKPPAQQASKAKNFKNQNLDGCKEKMKNLARNLGIRCQWSLLGSDFKQITEAKNQQQANKQKNIYTNITI